MINPDVLQHMYAELEKIAVASTWVGRGGMFPTETEFAHAQQDIAQRKAKGGGRAKAREILEQRKAKNPKGAALQFRVNTPSGVSGITSAPPTVTAPIAGGAQASAAPAPTPLRAVAGGATDHSHMATQSAPKANPTLVAPGTGAPQTNPTLVAPKAPKAPIPGPGQSPMPVSPRIRDQVLAEQAALKTSPQAVRADRAARGPRAGTGRSIGSQAPPAKMYTGPGDLYAAPIRPGRSPVPSPQTVAQHVPPTAQGLSTPGAPALAGGVGKAPPSTLAGLGVNTAGRTPVQLQTPASIQGPRAPLSRQAGAATLGDTPTNLKLERAKKDAPTKIKGPHSRTPTPRAAPVAATTEKVVSKAGKKGIAAMTHGGKMGLIGAGALGVGALGGYLMKRKDGRTIIVR